jgi:hypothetical protein
MNTKQSVISSQLSALDELKAKWIRDGEADDVEFAILMRNVGPVSANKAAEQYARLRTRNEQLEAALAKSRAYISFYEFRTGSDDKGNLGCSGCGALAHRREHFDNCTTAELLDELARLLADEQPADAGRYEKGG